MAKLVDVYVYTIQKKRNRKIPKKLSGIREFSGLFNIVACIFFLLGSRDHKKYPHNTFFLAVMGLFSKRFTLYFFH